MASHHPAAATASDPHLVPPALLGWLSVFRPCFTAPVWNRVLVLVDGAVLAPGKRTVTQALRLMGLADEPRFRRYHEVLSRARWDARAVARRLLLYMIDRLLPDGEVVIGIDDTIERRWGPMINARGIYRDPVRSSKGHFVKACPREGDAKAGTSGLRWLSLMVAVPIPWAGRTWALPFLTILAPSLRWSETHRKRHKTLTDWARQAILQTKHWLPHRRLVFVADSSFSALGLLAAVCRHVGVITRLRLDANLFKPAPKCRKGQRGRPPLKGLRLPKLSAVLANKKTVWTSVVVSQWYNAQQRKLLVATGTAVWYHAASRRCRSAGCWSAIRPASTNHRRFSAPTWPRHRRRSSVGSSRAGGWKPPSKRCAPILASRRSDSGPISPFSAPPQLCWGCSR